MHARPRCPAQTAFLDITPVKSRFPSTGRVTRVPETSLLVDWPQIRRPSTPREQNLRKESKCIRSFGCLETGLLRSSRSLLPTNLALFSRLLQLPIPLGVDLRLTPGGHVVWRRTLL